MGRFCVGTLAAILLVALAKAGKAADPEKELRPGTGKATGISWLWPFKKPQPKAPAVKTAPSKASTAGGSVSGESESAPQAREKAEWLRRIAVCDKLREVADLSNDEELRRRADQLDQRAWDMYLQRIAQLPVSNSGQQADERLLQKRSRPGIGLGLLSPPRWGSRVGHSSLKEE